MSQSWDNVDSMHDHLLTVHAQRCTRSELASLAHSFISVPHNIIVHVPSTTFTYLFMHMSKLAHVHILPDHVILSISKFVSCLAASLARTPKIRCLE